MLVESVQNRKIPTKSAVFYRLFFGEVSPESVSENPAIFDFFGGLIRSPVLWCNPSDISRTEVCINLEVNWLCSCDLAHFI